MIRATLSCACVVAVSVVSNVPARADKPINLEARFAQGVMKGGEKQRNYLRVGLNGCERPADRTHARQRRLRDRPLRLDAGRAHRAGARGGGRRDPPSRQERHRLGRDLRRQDRHPGAGAAGRRPCRLHRPHPAGHRPRLDRDPRRRDRGRAAGAAQFRPAPAQPRGAAVGRPGQCRAAPAGGFRQARPRAAAAGNLGEHHRARHAIQRRPDAPARARERRQPQLRRRIDRPDPGVQQGIRRRAGVLRADRLDRRRAQARRARRARAQPRRQDRRPDRAVPAQPGLCGDRALRADGGRGRSGCLRRRNRQRHRARPRARELHRARRTAHARPSRRRSARASARPTPKSRRAATMR